MSSYFVDMQKYKWNDVPLETDSNYYSNCYQSDDKVCKYRHGKCASDVYVRVLVIDLLKAKMQMAGGSVDGISDQHSPRQHTLCLVYSGEKSSVCRAY